MVTTVELPDDKVYGDCNTVISIDHQGHIPITFFDRRTGEDVVMVYLGKEEIEKIVKLYMENHELVEYEGEKPENPTPIQPATAIGIPAGTTPTP